MFNFKLFKYILLFVSLLVVAGLPAFAVTEAGEKQTREEKTPKSNFKVTNNITDISGVSETNEESEIVENIDFSADEVINDEENNVITANGDVEIKYKGMRLTTDKLVYDENKEIITALGDTHLYTADGAIVEGNHVVLSDNMSVGEMYNIKVLLKDKSTVTAERFRKKDNRKKYMDYATYTACDICAGKSPLWQVKARKVQHNENTQNVNYNDAFIYIKGVPVFYTPFLTHPDPSVKRRSGLLPSTIGSTSFLGGFVQPRYFWAVNDQTNVIFSPILSSDKNIVWGGEYKQYFYDSNISVSGSYLRDDEKGRQENRGNAFIIGRKDINDLWRLKYNLKYVSDYLYLKDLNLPYDDDAWLNSEVKLERFSGRDYVSIDAYYYKLLSYDLRRRYVQQYSELNDRKPIVAPLIEAEFYTDPYDNGSYFRNQINTASIYHNNGEQTQRVTSINSWELPTTTRFGEKYRFVASVKSDVYYINDYHYSNNNNDTYTGTTARIFPQAGVEWRLPFVKATESSRHIIEPVIVGVIAPEGGNKVDKIPNEDSEDVYFDDTNVLDLDRYAGYDRNDTGSRISYGFRWNSYDDFMGRISSFIAQTYEKNPHSSFMKGLDNTNNSHFSDFVGRFNAEPNKYLNFNYRFRLDRKNLDAKYSEIGAGVGPSLLRVNASYIFLEGNTHYTNKYSERKELYLALSSKFSQYWSFRVYNLRDLTSNNRRSLEHGGNIIYEDECFKWLTTVRKYNSTNPSLDNDYEFGVTFYLKTIGSVGS